MESTTDVQTPTNGFQMPRGEQKKLRSRLHTVSFHLYDIWGKNKMVGIENRSVTDRDKVGWEAGTRNCFCG